ncbi:recombinase family protein [Streptomyces virginiae]|uniref:recombinase family protein n=1 Tax=Streptomyces virginiae TaxID=1961 RepID=UPI00379101F6
MADYAYERVSTDKQSTERQTFTLAQSGVTFDRTFSDPATSSRISPLGRSEFKALMSVVNPGDTIHISEMFRLVRSVRDLHDVLELLHSRGALLKIHSGAFSSIDLTARDSKGKLRAEVKFLVTCLAAAGEFQRDLQSELTVEGQAAARAKGKHMGRKPKADAAAVRADWESGTTSINALAKKHGVSRGAIRTALGDLYEKESEALPDTPAEPVHTVTMAGALADYLTAEGTAGAEVLAGVETKTTRRGKGYSLAVTATAAVHADLVDIASVLASADGADNTPAERKAYRAYADKVSAL